MTEHASGKRPRRPWGNYDDECRQALRPLSQAVGDFQATLTECKKLLGDHDRFQRDPAGFVDNILWHTGTQKDVDILRERVHFHSTKLLVITKPFELYLLLEIRQELQALRKDVADLRGLLVTVLSDGKLADCTDAGDLNVVFLDIPTAVGNRFCQAVAKPKAYSLSLSFAQEYHMPLSEWFDALVYQFARSTVDFKPGVDKSQKVPHETQFINLLKSRWIMDQLERSPHFLELDSGSLWASYLRELKADIIREYKRFRSNQLIPPPQDNIIGLPDQCFSIWAADTLKISPPDLTEQRPFEDLILETELPDSTSITRKAVLKVFRRSTIEFRLVTAITDFHIPGYHQEKDFIVNTNTMKVIPAYAAPESADYTNNILLSSSHVKDLRWQYLSNSEDVVALHQALIGYRVHHSAPNIRWSLDGSSKFGRFGKGEIQLWQPQALPNLNVFSRS